MSISIDVPHRHAGRPAEFAHKTCLLRDIFKRQPAPVEIKAILIHVGRKIQIGQAVAIHVAGSYAAPIIEVFVLQHIEPVPFYDPVPESNARLAGGQACKERCSSIFARRAAARTAQAQKK